MITVFREGGKPFVDETATIIQESKVLFNPDKSVCAGCGAEGALVYYCVYMRYLDELVDGATTRKEIALDRYKCEKCDKTHVVAPGELLIPYTLHSLGFIIAVLKAYIKREQPVRQIVEKYQIVVSTLYVWIKKFSSHYELLYGKLQAASGDTGEHLEDIAVRKDLPHRLFIFVQTHKIAFLQTPRKAQTSCFFTLRGFLISCRGASP